MSGLLARHSGRHCRHGSFTGWSGLAHLVAAAQPVLDFTRRRVSHPAVIPVADELIPFGPNPRFHPYPKETAR
ncbi:hypothetical protein ACIBHX_01610 [Nonomuraea sp. NPDC050536]|uniref:hypothetical protein n=1 Tax=Nonomuraea sp. NPDC050536 TaxID=3364366 RepID=UPI0037C56434